MKKIYFLVFAVAAVLSANGQVFIPDSLYGNNSIGIYDVGAGEDFTEFILQPDSNIIIGGFDYDISLNAYLINMARIDVCGNRDVSFGDSGFVRYTFSQRNTAYDFALQPDGKILSVGVQSTSNAGSGQIPYVARFNSDGQPDTNFATAGSNTLRFDNISSGGFYSVYPMADGRIVAIGRSSGNINGGSNGVGAMRFFADGSLDTTFDGDGITRFTGINPGFGYVPGHVLQDGHIVTVSFYYDGSFMSHFAVVAFDSTGTMDSTFAVSGLFTDTVNLTGRVYTVLDQGKIVMASQRDPAAEGIEIVRINSNGTADSTFGVNGHVNLNITGVTVRGLRLMNTGNLLVMGELTPPTIGIAIMLTPDGSLDSTFGINGVHNFDLAGGTSGNMLNDMIELQNNRYLGGGTASSQYITRRFSLVSNVPHITFIYPELVTAPQAAHQWYVDGTLIPGATSNTHVPVVVGGYTVEITDDMGCTYMSDTFTISSLNVNAIEQDFVSAGPNPADDALYLRFSNDIPLVHIAITDITGKIIQSGTYTAVAKSISLPLNFLHSGVYVIHIFNDQHSTAMRIIKR